MNFIYFILHIFEEKTGCNIAKYFHRNAFICSVATNHACHPCRSVTYKCFIFILGFTLTFYDSHITYFSTVEALYSAYTNDVIQNK